MNIYRNTEDKFLKHRCNICEKQILTKEKIKQHQDEVHKNKGLKCTECNHRVKSRWFISLELWGLNSKGPLGGVELVVLVAGFMLQG